MRRFVTLAVLLLFTVPFGISISGCSKGTSVTYCNGQNSGVQQGQTVALDLEPRLTGISINQGAIGSIGAPTGYDCQHHVASVTGTIYASTDRNIIDVNPTQGAGGLCAGSWNRNSGAGVPDYTVCSPNGNQGVAYITASAGAVVSNPVAVYVHPVVTSIVLGAPSVDCVNDPASNCFAPNTTACYAPTAASPSPAPPVVGTPYNGAACVSQGQTAQLAARSFAGTGTGQSNISCLVGPLSFTATNTAVLTIDTNGIATATQPGSSTINAANAQSSSTTGSFSTCPPKSIVLTQAGQTTPPAAPVNLSQNVTQTLIATVVDTNNVAINNIGLTYISTTPTTIPTNGSSITPTFPGAASITAVCQPPACNSSPFNLIGLYGNGLPITSEPVQVTATGTGNSTVLYIASTQSQYILPVDFTVTTQPTPVRLPYPPNSLVLSEDGTSIYMGTQNEIMTYSTSTNSVTAQNAAISGEVLAVSPDNTTIVVSDPVRQLTYLLSSTGSVTAEIGGVGLTAQFSNDSTTVYIPTRSGQLLVHSTFTGWTTINLAAPAFGVAATVPNAGVYLAANPVDVRTNCPATIATGSGVNQSATNTFYPDYGPVPGALAPNTTVPGALPGYDYITNNIASTNDGLHELAASPLTSGGAATFTDIATNQKSGPCPVLFNSTVSHVIPFSVAQPSAIVSVLPTSDSAFAFVTYTGTGSVVPQYVPATGALTNIALQTTAAGTPIAPVAGVVSSDNQTVYIGTSGDNLVHRLTRGTGGFADTLAPLTPALPALSGTGTATPNFLVQKPRKAVD
jgi:hypothetical protein